MQKQTHIVDIGGIPLGGKNPIRVQSMTNTPTADVNLTIKQIIELTESGSEYVRITINDEQAANAVPEIIKQLKKKGFETPIIGDFHFNGHILLEKFPEMAKAISKYRINPGNVGKGNKKDENFEKIIKCAIKYDKPVRIGVNSGSLDEELLREKIESFGMEVEEFSEKFKISNLKFKNNLKGNNGKIKNLKLKINEIDPSLRSGGHINLDYQQIFVEAMVKSAIISVKKAESYGLASNKIVLSVKMSDVQDMIKAYELLSSKVKYPLHLGLTEAGGMTKGIVASSAALAILLQQGIGNTIRVSITPEPGAKRSLEVEVCKHLLQSMGLRYFQPQIISCPGCGRTSSDKFQKLAKQISEEIEKRMPKWKKKYSNFENTKIAVMGCIVNGPGESKHADIGISLPGNFENPQMPVYIKGKLFKNLQGENVFEEFMEIVEKHFDGKS